MKRAISLLLMLTIFISSNVIASASSNSKIKFHKKYGYSYVVLKDGNVLIENYYGKKSNLVIPEQIDGHTVVKIGWDDNDDIIIQEEFDDEPSMFCFYGNNRIKVLTIPDTVKEIASGTFQRCKKLEKVVLGKGIKTIEDAVFADCKNLKKIRIPSSVTEIGSYAFRNSNLKKFTIGKNINYISVDTHYVFGNSPIKEIKVSKQNKKYCSKKGVLYNKNKTSLLYYPVKKKKSSFVIPKSVKSINDYAFNKQKNLKKITISNKVRIIGDSAFSDIKKLTKVKFKTKGNLNIEEYAFWNCKALKSVKIPQKAKIKKEAFGFISKRNKSVRMKGFTIKGYKGTAAEKYAKKNKFKFVALK